jgi:hypothetical protein
VPPKKKKKENKHNESFYWPLANTGLTFQRLVRFKDILSKQVICQLQGANQAFGLNHHSVHCSNVGAINDEESEKVFT